MSTENPNARLETFCDGVFAIAITLLILELRAPFAESIHSSEELWQSLEHLLPAVFAFLLSFITILITWVNHHAAFKLMSKSSPHFIYANGVLLLAVVVIPFPTSLLGEFLLTDHAQPAVSLYSAVFALLGVGWMLMGRAALNSRRPLARSEKAVEEIVANTKRSHYAIVFYTVCAVAAFWFPMAVAIIVAASWITWLVIGINVKEE
jgi:uncharacterized membrane protein